MVRWRIRKKGSLYIWQGEIGRRIARKGGSSCRASIGCPDASAIFAPTEAWLTAICRQVPENLLCGRFNPTGRGKFVTTGTLVNDNPFGC